LSIRRRPALCQGGRSAGFCERVAPRGVLGQLAWSRADARTLIKTYGSDIDQRQAAHCPAQSRTGKRSYSPGSHFECFRCSEDLAKASRRLVALPWRLDRAAAAATNSAARAEKGWLRRDFSDRAMPEHCWRIFFAEGTLFACAVEVGACVGGPLAPLTSSPRSAGGAVADGHTHTQMQRDPAREKLTAPLFRAAR
jgi:hypothetical protein